ncbi:MAG TPA: lipase secretion chaperone, partial [Pseudomonadales bacterium]|nr:lipase secretion chaperone [Pseudomonadales bacterium]
DAGAPETDIRKLREQMVGPDAAARLEVLDKEQQDWSDRLELFRAEKKKIIDNPGLSDDAKQKMVESLLEARFSELERQRVESLEAE